MHIRSRVCVFVCPERFFAANMLPYAPVGCFLFFTGSHRNIKARHTERRFFIMNTNTTTALFYNETGDVHEEIKKQIIIHGV